MPRSFPSTPRHIRRNDRLRKERRTHVLLATLTACSDVVIWAIDLKRGMGLGPWHDCIDRLATTPEQATALLRDAVSIMEARAEFLAAHGRRVWEPTPEMPALVIIIDEYAELAEQAPEAMDDTDSLARIGRAVAVTMVAATQRPTQEAMGKVPFVRKWISGFASVSVNSETWTWSLVKECSRPDGTRRS